MCDPEKKAAFQAAQAAADNTNADGFEDNNNADGGNGWEPAPSNFGSSGQAGWESNVTPAKPVAVGGAW